MIGDKDADMQAADKAGVGIKCHYLVGADGVVVSSAATHKIDSLREAITLLSQSDAA
jgi:phosphoglycolate phosphatase-like HAD superfamily hydrolase